MGDNQPQKIATEAVDSIHQQFPQIPSDYLNHLTTVGFGSQANGRYLYPGPIHPSEIYGDSLANSTVVLLGDDGMGYCFGVDLQSNLFGEFTPHGDWQPWAVDRRFADYVAI